MYNYPIRNWNDIKDVYSRGSLLLGNGASIAVDQRFGYSSLKEHAIEYGLMPEDVFQLFTYFKTEDFELILRLVWQASYVNVALNIQDKKTHDAYLRVRESLIQTVRDIHPEHNEVHGHIPYIYEFIKCFDTVLSLNYDLLVYWAIMYGLDQRDEYKIKDCFIHQLFDDNWHRFRVPYRSKYVSLVFYPHGNLILGRNLVNQEFKLVSDDYSLLGSILDAWEREEAVPLFISEGKEEQKINSIKNSNYLNTIYREVLPSIGDRLVIYGWGFGEQDLYILNQIRLSGVKYIAISVYDRDLIYCNRIAHIIAQTIGIDIHIDFFDSSSSGCWNNP